MAFFVEGFCILFLFHCSLAQESTTTLGGQVGGCHYNGRTYWAGDNYMAIDGCNTCYCSAHGGSLCTEKACPPVVCHYNGTDHKIGSSFPSTDGCNTCTCFDKGSVACTEMWCIKGCTYHGQHHDFGTTFKSVDGCNTCHCVEKDGQGAVSCTEKACLKAVCNYNGKTYNVGSGFPADDGCNRCFCGAGGFVACTKMYCPHSSTNPKLLLS